VGGLLRQLGRVEVLVYDDQDHEPSILRNPVRQRWATWLENTMIRRADVAVSVGHRLAALRRAETGRTLEVIPNGVRAGLGAAAARLRQPADRPFTLVYVGNVVDWSGLDVMLGGLPQVLAGGLALRVLIVGDGLPSYVRSLREQVARLGLGDAVTFTGRVPNDRIADWLAQADVGLAHFRPEPYRRYACPLKVLEYMAAGLAVIGTVDTETEDLLRHHGSGLAVAFGQDAIVGAIVRLAADRALRSRCQQQALQAASAYQWPLLAARQMALAEAAAQRRAALEPAA
jgi:glycosyltransferase involved in cell wall biosynthesis